MDWFRSGSRARLAAAATAGALLVLDAPAVAHGATTKPPGGEVPAEVRRALGDRVERAEKGHLRVRLRDNTTLLTHGPDAIVAAGDDNLLPGAPERAPICASDFNQHVLYGRRTFATSRFPAVKAQIQSAVRRMNNVLNSDSLASGGRTADFRVLCDAGGQVRVDEFASSLSDFESVVSAARAAGFNRARTNYTIFFDDSTYCGVASISDDESLSVNNRNNQGGGYAVVGSPCWNGRTPMHEASHNLGAVQYGSPYGTGYNALTGNGGHCRDGLDVMCYSDGGDRDTGMIARCTDRMHYDCGADDYFDSAPEPGEYLATHWNIGSPLNRFIAFGGQDGTVMAWGLNSNGQMGTGILGINGVAAPTNVTPPITAVSAGGYHSLARHSDGSAWAWGLNNVGQLGDASTTDRAGAVRVQGLDNVVAVSAGFAHSLALKADGTVWAWGWNVFGQLGDGSVIDRATPVPVPGLSGVVAISGGVAHSLAVRSDGTVAAWGLNHVGQLGDGSAVVQTPVPVTVSGLTGASSVGAGGYHSLARKTDGTVWAWGYNHAGQLGNGSMDQVSRVPVQATGLSGVVEVATGVHHSLARRADGTVWSWGWNGTGQLGNGTMVDRRVPQAVNGLTGATGISGGWFHTMVVRSDQTVHGWGWGGYGQLGNIAVFLLSQLVHSSHRMQTVSAGLAHNLTVVGQ